ncbi:SDR family NAD(P)-dependent oxidoreductase [bacterium]|nr:SDR family NAD(P)-dependent oxidoreductase [bacterium]
MHWQAKKVLVTGAGGFIGSHLTEKLLNLGANVIAFVRYNSRNDQGALELLAPEVKEKVEIIMGDLRNSEALRDATKEIDMVFHLGALIAIPYSYLQPREVIETNVIGTLNVLSAAKVANARKVIHTSTSEVYGTAQYVPIDEKHPLQGQSPYSASKIGADKIAESFYKSYGLPVAIIRPFNTYGPRQSARAVIPTIISQTLSNDRVYLGSSHPTRDLTYVEDTVNGFIKIAESEKSIGEVINIGSNSEISIGKLADKILSLVGKKIEIISDLKRVRPQDSEVERLLADNAKAQRLIGWKPMVSLDEGLRRTIEWIKDNLERYKTNIYNV